jgi:hypothetical protein
MVVEGELVTHRVDLFDSRCFQWACGDDLYVLPAGEGGQVALAEAGDSWRVWHLSRESERVVAENLDLEYAQGVAEDLVRRLGGAGLARRGAAWRDEAASQGQLTALGRMGLAAPMTMTRGEASELLSLEIARRALQPATSRQLYALQARGTKVPPGLTKREASRLLGGGGRAA